MDKQRTQHPAISLGPDAKNSRVWHRRLDRNSAVWKIIDLYSNLKSGIHLADEGCLIHWLVPIEEWLLRPIMLGGNRTGKNCPMSGRGPTGVSPQESKR